MADSPPTDPIAGPRPTSPDSTTAVDGAGGRRGRSASSTGIVGLGVVALGLGTYAYLALCARALDLSSFARLSVVVTAIITIGPGLFLPIEQETARGLAHRLATSASGRLLARKAGQIGGAFALVATVLIVGTAIAGVDRLLDGDIALLVTLALGIASLLPAYLSRGVLAGSGHTTRYAVQLALDGALRASGAGALALAGSGTAWHYGAVLTAAPMISVALSMLGLRAQDMFGAGPDEPISTRELVPAMGYLVGGSLAMQALANAGPVAVKVLTSAQSDQAGRFLAALVLARSPLFVVSALQATLVPAWAAMLARGDASGMRRRIGVTAAVMAALVAAVVPAAMLLGPAALRVIYGADYVLARHTIGLLVLGAGVYCVAVIVGLGLIALRRQSALCAGWGLGFAVFVAFCFLPYAVADRVAIALGAGALATLCWFGAAIRRSRAL